MTTVLHVVVGPDEHGVVRHGRQTADDCGHRLLRCPAPDAVVPADLVGVDVVHVPFTDRLFGPTCEQAATAFTDLAGLIDRRGATRSVTLHDLPAGDSPLARRRRTTYRAVVDGARGVVTNSRHELALVDELADTAWSRRVIPLPVDHVTDGPAPDAPEPGTVGILGFLYPGKGIEDVLEAVPTGADVRSLGGAAAGHPEQAALLATRAAELGVSYRVSGFLPDTELADALARIAVPVAPHRAVSASGSVATWIAHGRRPLVPDGPYTREIDVARPGTVRRYDAERPGALGQEIAAALADPARTRIAPGATIGPSRDEVAHRYHRHLVASAAPRALRVGRGWTVPGNRWDLLDRVAVPESPEISVVVPYYDAPEHLDLVLGALARQDHPHSRLEVVVADDGSPRSPRLDAVGPLRARLVRQRDDGFRAGAARNLGARVCDGEVLAFLDGDTVPEPGYLTALARLPALTADGLTVGRRRHADLASISRWREGTTTSPEPLGDPAWLAEGYASSRDLLDADERSYRYVISAVLAMHRELFEATEGFCEEFRTYGGEDWELAARAWHAGAVVAHVPDAVAWHVGPDWAGRGPGRPDKAAEAAMLARLLPDPATRTPGVDHRYPAVVVIVETADRGVADAAVDAARRAGADVGVWCPAGPAGDDRPAVRVGHPPPDVLARATTVVTLTAPGSPEPLVRPLDRGTVVAPVGRARGTRVSARAARVASRVALDADEVAERLFGFRDVP